MKRELSIRGDIVNVARENRAAVGIYHVTRASAKRIIRLIAGKVPGLWSPTYSPACIWFMYSFPKQAVYTRTLDSRIIQARLNLPSKPTGSYISESLSAN